MKPTYEELEAECAALNKFKTAVYQQMDVGCEAPVFAITVGIGNLRRFADTLHAVEREFFTREVPDEENEDETVEQCPMHWGMSVEEYVHAFGKSLSEVRAQGAEGFIAFCGEENSVFVESKAYYRSLPDAVAEFAAQLRQEAQ
ncbi:hypothetical protein [Citrobacter sp. NCU1]|uniref:hypothetical protein n=1 Tax=Citrobacter sp. NCU1 TaxID=2026683 RepID=UPI001EE37AE0|nr:hypothetical protein [Citrobacter sp. NCU1]